MRSFYVFLCKQIVGKVKSMLWVTNVVFKAVLSCQNKTDNEEGLRSFDRKSTNGLRSSRGSYLRLRSYLKFAYNRNVIWIYHIISWYDPGCPQWISPQGEKKLKTSQALPHKDKGIKVH